MTLDEHWRELNVIVRFALETGMEIEHDDSGMQLYLRGAEIQARYEAGSETWIVLSKNLISLVESSA